MPEESLIQNNAAARDLEWVLKSPTLIQGKQNHCNWTSNSFWQQISTDYTAQLLQIESKSDTLSTLISEQADHRLGHYFETLLSHFFTTSHRYEVLAHNLQVQDSTRTIGEFDFILKDLLTNKTQHWEVACKFYLGINDTSQIDNWYGPMLKDKLANKYQQMQTRQSQLSEQHSAQLALDNLSIHVDQKICVMKGRLFYPLLQIEQTTPSIMSDTHLKSWWAQPNEFLQHDKASPLRWFILDKKQWLAEQVFDDNNRSFTSNELLKTFLSKYNRPICVAGFNPAQSSVELERGFLVPKDWGHQIGITH